MASLSFESHREHLQELIRAALAAADPAVAVRQALRRDGRELRIGRRRYKLGRGRVFVVGAGKAAAAMGRAAAAVLGETLTAGALIAKAPPGPPAPGHDLAPGLRLYYGGHPVPDGRSVEATEAVVELISQAAAGDLVLCLISGGASALLTRPAIPLPEWQALVDVLLGSGCTIHELNGVRKQLDMVKGGGLARLAAPASVASLILSDVVGNRLDVIGSGPTAPNPERPADARRTLEDYRVAAKLPVATWQRIVAELARRERESPIAAGAVAHVVIGDVRRTAQASVEAARLLGFRSRLLTAHLEGEARQVGRMAAALAKDAPAGSCLILGGETTVTLRGQGHGGRNQEVALAAALALDGRPHVVVASFASDGEDGPTGAAGAIATGETAGRARALGMEAADYLARNDSFPFFEKLGGLIQTGPTGTNVNDLLFILRYPGGGGRDQ